MTSNNYSYYCDGDKCYKGEYEKYGIDYNEDDIVEMIIDFNKRTISFNVNDLNQGIAYYDIKQSDDIEYRFAVYS